MTAQVPDDDVPDYGLLDDAGNRRLQRVLAGLAAAVRQGEVERVEAVTALSDELRALSEDYPEAVDITVRDAVVRELDPVFRAAGFEGLEPFEF